MSDAEAFNEMCSQTCSGGIALDPGDHPDEWESLFEECMSQLSSGLTACLDGVVPAVSVMPALPFVSDGQFLVRRRASLNCEIGAGELEDCGQIGRVYFDLRPNAQVSVAPFFTPEPIWVPDGAIGCMPPRNTTPCRTCTPVGPGYESHFLGGIPVAVPTLMPVVVSEPGGMGDGAPCNSHRVDAWRQQIQACINPQYEDENWFVFSDETGQQADVAQLDPQESYYFAFMSRMAGSGLAQTPMQDLAGAASCIADTYAIYSTWMFDFDSNGECDWTPACPEFVTPHGEPTVSPSDIRFHESSELVFDNGGLLEFDVTISGIPGTVDLDDVEITMDALDDGEFGPSLEASIGDLVADGENHTATIRFDQMPLSNSGFGPKTISVCLPNELLGCERCVSQTVELFWPVYEEALLGGGPAGDTLESHYSWLASGGQEHLNVHVLRASNPRIGFERDNLPFGIIPPNLAGTIPNFFHYWLQIHLPADGPTLKGYFEHENSRFTYRGTFGGVGTHGVFLAPQYFHLGDSAHSSILIAKGSSTGSSESGGLSAPAYDDTIPRFMGVLNFVHTLFHEHHHKLQWKQFSADFLGNEILRHSTSRFNWSMKPGNRIVSTSRPQDGINANWNGARRGGWNHGVDANLDGILEGHGAEPAGCELGPVIAELASPSRSSSAKGVCLPLTRAAELPDGECRRGLLEIADRIRAEGESGSVERLCIYEAENLDRDGDDIPDPVEILSIAGSGAVIDGPYVGRLTANKDHQSFWPFLTEHGVRTRFADMVLFENGAAPLAPQMNAQWNAGQGLRDVIMRQDWGSPGRQHRTLWMPFD